MGNNNTSIPKTAINQENYPFIAAPYIEKGDIAFKDSTLVSLKSATKEATIFYSLNNSEPKTYNKPFIVSENLELSVFAKKKRTKSNTINTAFIK